MSSRGRFDLQAPLNHLEIFQDIIVSYPDPAVLVLGKIEFFLIYPPITAEPALSGLFHLRDLCRSGTLE